jgi:hypothetical protein
MADFRLYSVAFTQQEKELCEEQIRNILGWSLNSHQYALKWLADTIPKADKVSKTSERTTEQMRESLNRKRATRETKVSKPLKHFGVRQPASLVETRKGQSPALSKTRKPPSNAKLVKSEDLLRLSKAPSKQKSRKNLQ